MAEVSDNGGGSEPPVSFNRFGIPVQNGRRIRRGPDVARPRSVIVADTIGEERQQRVVFGIFVTLMLGFTLLQKFGLGPGSLQALAVIVPLTFSALVVGIMFARPVFQPIRILLYLALVACSALSNSLFSATYSLGSMGLYFLLYLPLLVAFDTTPETYRRCLRFFTNVMLAFAVVVWLQHAVQFSIGWRYWPNLDKLVPAGFLIPEFIYMQPIKYGLDYMKPTGVVFLEVSILSQFITLALIIELMFFQRLWRAAFLGATLFATFAGTGLLLLIVSLPIVFSRMTVRTFVIVLATMFVALFVALQLNWFDLVASRFGELQHTGTSGSSRFVEPLKLIQQALAKPSGLYAGIGAGQIEHGIGTFWWPMVKATVEYGLIAGLLLYAFFLFAMFHRSPSRQLAFVLVLWYSFEGTLLTPLNPLTCVMLSTMFILRPERPKSRLAARSSAAAGSPPAEPSATTA